MAGGIKVAVWSAVGPGPRCWGARSGGAAWLLLVVAGCVVCASGNTTGAAAVLGPGSRALNLEKWFHPEGAARYSERRGALREPLQAPVTVRAVGSGASLRGARVGRRGLSRPREARPGLGRDGDRLGAAWCRWAP